MAANLTIDKIFADNLGTAFGGCVRDQSLNLFFTGNRSFGRCQLESPALFRTR